ncbi:hypothetical protein [Paraburkholderia rhynchosiae]|uniref:hypothetical protein n=1 Tax=Paraburkholderia rhynchosiae TaxID=487049 RepID=UPI0011AF9160|nr:hypothetical protein [Paraburkholderia rhynchosiae]
MFFVMVAIRSCSDFTLELASKFQRQGRDPIAHASGTRALREEDKEDEAENEAACENRDESDEDNADGCEGSRHTLLFSGTSVMGGSR